MCKSLLLLMLPSFLLAAEPTVKLVSAPRQSPPSAQPVVPTFVSVAPMPASLDGLPCFNCVAGESLPTIGIPMPAPAIPTGSDAVFTMVIDDYTYNGACSATFDLLVNKQVTQTYTYDLPSGCTAHTNYLVTWQTNIGQASGPAAIEGVVTAGGASRSITATFTAGAPTQAVGLAFIAAGADAALTDLVTPCLNCVIGVPSPTLGILVPITTFALNQYSVIDVLSADYSFTGPCAVGISVETGGVGIGSGGGENYTCAPGVTQFDQFYFLPKKVGSYIAYGRQTDDNTTDEAVNELKFSVQ